MDFVIHQARHNYYNFILSESKSEDNWLSWPFLLYFAHDDWTANKVVPNFDPYLVGYQTNLVICSFAFFVDPHISKKYQVCSIPKVRLDHPINHSNHHNFHFNLSYFSYEFTRGHLIKHSNHHVFHSNLSFIFNIKWSDWYFLKCIQKVWGRYLYQSFVEDFQYLKFPTLVS